MIIGAAIILGVIAASMSTASGVVLDLANLVTRSLLQRYSRTRWNDATMLLISRWIALPTMGFAVAFAYVRPEPGILLILAFDIVLAGCFVPLAMGIYWRRANAPGAVAAMVVGTSTRIIMHWLVPESLAGMDTLLAPVAGLVAFVTVSLATQKIAPPKHGALTEVPTDEELVAG